MMPDDLPPNAATDATQEPGPRPEAQDASARKRPADYNLRKPPMRPPSAAAITDYRQTRLVKRSALFEAGDPDAANDDDAFVRRLSARVALARSGSDEAHHRGDVTRAVKAKGGGIVHVDAELAAFSKWLTVDGAPGLKRTGGPIPDTRLVLKTLAVAMAELHFRDVDAPPSQGKRRVAADAKLTPTILADAWSRVLGAAARQSDFSSRIKTLRRLLPAYLGHLASGAMWIGGKRARTSATIARVLQALNAPRPPAAGSRLARNGRSPSSTSIAAPPVSRPRTPVTAADLQPFVVPLRYSSSATEAEYRQRPVGSLPLPVLRYVPRLIQPSQPGRSVRPDRIGQLVFEPDLEIRGNYRVEALIDRMILLLATRQDTSWRRVKALLNRVLGRSVFVHDRSLSPCQEDWRAELPPLDPASPTKCYFAVLLQDPEPDSLARMLQAIDRAWGIEGPVLPFLIETSVDFYPRDDRSEDERLALRERMVALLQRHHWCGMTALMKGERTEPRQVDARLVYPGSRKGSAITRFLFARRRGTRHQGDSEVHLRAVRQRILEGMQTAQTLRLDGTLYRGALGAGAMTSAQHKIADRRNLARASKRDLVEQERRARIEVVLLGAERLNALGLVQVEDLTRISFRRLRKDLLMFRRLLVPAFREDIEDAKAQFAERGLYGWAHWCHAREAQEKLGVRAAASSSVPFRAGSTMMDWPDMNRAVGDALDRLEARWRGFSWR